METFVAIKKFVPDPAYLDNRRKYQMSLDIDSIDTPIRKIIECTNDLEDCFTADEEQGIVYVFRRNPWAKKRLLKGIFNKDLNCFEPLEGFVRGHVVIISNED